MRRIVLRWVPVALVAALVLAPISAIGADKGKPQTTGQSADKKPENLSNNGNNGVQKPGEPTAQVAAEQSPAPAPTASVEPAGAPAPVSPANNGSNGNAGAQNNANAQGSTGSENSKPSSGGADNAKPSTAGNATPSTPEPKASEPAAKSTTPSSSANASNNAQSGSTAATAQTPSASTSTSASAPAATSKAPAKTSTKTTASKSTATKSTATKSTSTKSTTTKTAAAKKAETATNAAATAAFDPDLACGSKTIGAANERSVTAAEARAERAAQQAAAAKSKTRTPIPAAPAEAAANYVVRLKRGADVASEADAAAGLGNVQRRFTEALAGFTVSLTPTELCELEKRNAVESIEDDVAVSMMDTQSNPVWGLDRIDQSQLPLSGTYTYTTAASGVRVYVVDTGIRADHQELAGRVMTGFTAIADGNGTTDCNGHGTHVAGTVAGTTWGVAKQASVVPVRVLGCDGSGTSSGVISGLDWIAANAQAPAVVNMSLGGGASSTLDAAVNNLIAKGFTVVVAAGNSSTDACTSSPARVGAAVTVAASDVGDRSASFTNYGSCVDLYGPGVGITSASIASTTASVTYSGTSMATPHVAGVAALFLAANPSATPAVVSSSLAQAATAGVIQSLPTNTVNRLLYSTTAAVQVPVATVPAAPTDLQGTTTRRSVTLRWTPAADGGSPLTEYRVIMTQGTTTRTYLVSATATSALIRNLKSGKIYTFRIVAVNAVGQSAPSNTVTLTVA